MVLSTLQYARVLNDSWQAVHRELQDKSLGERRFGGRRGLLQLLVERVMRHLYPDPLRCQRYMGSPFYQWRGRPH